MKIEDVEALEKQVAGKWISSEVPIHQALSALRAEAWHPIEKAEELGAKAPDCIVLLFRIDYWVEGFWDADYQCWNTTEGEIKPSHFRFINPPEGA